VLSSIICEEHEWESSRRPIPHSNAVIIDQQQFPLLWYHSLLSSYLSLLDAVVHLLRVSFILRNANIQSSVFWDSYW
jgi:hypothetical protein